MQCTINTSVCVCSSHLVTGDLMLIAVDQKDRVLTRTCSLTTPIYCTQEVLVISQYEYDILVITRVRGEAEDEC